jgi:U3 small nucleolar RNA-associated protein MPP10
VEHQAPAITIESVGKSAVSRDAALAPQDLYRPSKKKFEGASIDELAPSEKSALRRMKKSRSNAAKKGAIKKKALKAS